MKHTNTKAFKAVVFQYLIDSAYDCDDMSEQETVQHIYDRWQSEYCYPDNIKRFGDGSNNAANWLQGLPLNIDYLYVDIIKTAELWHETTLTESQQQKVCDNWWKFLAMKLIQLFKHYGVTQ